MGDQRPALRVDGYGVDGTRVTAVVDAFLDVEVTEPGAGDGATVEGFLAYLVGDVGAAGPGLVFVNGVQDHLD